MIRIRTAYPWTSIVHGEMCLPAALGAGRQAFWTGDDSFDVLQRVCGGLTGPGGTYVSERVDLPHRPTGRYGIEVASCERCRDA